MRNIITAILALVMGWASPALALVDIETRALSSGAELWVATDTSLPVVSMRLRFEGGGTASDPQDKAGLAAIATTMMGEGAGNQDALAFKQALADKAIQLSISASDDALHVSLRCLRTHVPDALALLADALARPHFSEAALERVKREHQASLVRLGQSPSYLASKALQEAIFAGHPYAADGMGTPQTVDAINAADMRSYQQRVIAASRAEVVVAGALSMRDARALFRAFFADLPQKTLDHTPIPEATMQPVAEPIRLSLPLPQSAIRMALPWPGRDHPDFYAAYVLNTVLGGGVLNSHLGDVLRRQEGLVYDVGTQLSLRDAANLMLVRAATRNAQAVDAVARMREVLAAVQANGIGQNRCEEAKQYIVGQLPLFIDSTGGLASMLALMQHEKLGADYLRERAELFGNVSCEQVNRVASEWLDPAKLAIAVAGGQAEVAPEAP